jgi:hypothetical protein
MRTLGDWSEDVDDLQNSPETEGTSEDNGMTNEGVYVKMIDTLGTIFLGSLCLILLFALLREQARNRELLASPGQQ